MDSTMECNTYRTFFFSETLFLSESVNNGSRTIVPEENCPPNCPDTVNNSDNVYLVLWLGSIIFNCLKRALQKQEYIKEKMHGLRIFD